MLAAPRVVGHYPGIFNFHVKVALPVHGHCQQKRPVPTLDPVTVVVAIYLILHIVKVTEGISQSNFVEQTKPRQVNRLMRSQNHLASTNLSIISSTASESGCLDVNPITS